MLPKQLRENLLKNLSATSVTISLITSLFALIVRPSFVILAYLSGKSKVKIVRNVESISTLHQLRDSSKTP